VTLPKTTATYGYSDGIGTAHDTHATDVIQSRLRHLARVKKLKKAAAKKRRSARGANILLTVQVQVRVRVDVPAPARKPAPPPVCGLSPRAAAEAFEENPYALEYRRPRTPWDGAAAVGVKRRPR